MGDVRSLYYDQWLGAAYKLLDHVVEAVEVWDSLPDYRREGKLVYFDQLVSYMAILHTGEATKKLSRAQIRKLRSLERLVKQAEGVIKVLQARHEAACSKEE